MKLQAQLRANLPKRDMVMTEDVIKLFSLSLEATEEVKTKLEKLLETSTGSITKEISDALSKITDLESKLDVLGEELSVVETQGVVDLDNSIKEIREELKRIEQLIPNIPEVDFTPLEKRITDLETKIFPQQDLSYLEERITEVEGKIPTIPEAKQVSGEEMRDKLEGLEGEERLDVSAIKNLPKITISPVAPKDPEKHDLWIKIL